MAAGKMTVGLELYSYLKDKHIKTGFVATDKWYYCNRKRNTPRCI